MKQSDWKTFKQIKEQAIEFFCSRALEEFEEVIKDREASTHERYSFLYRLVDNRDKHMALLFDDHSRYIAPLQPLAIRVEGLADENLLNKLSEDFLESTDPKRTDWQPV